MYDRLFNTLAVLTLTGVTFIVITTPMLFDMEDDPQPLRKYRKCIDIDLSVSDVSAAFEIEANREKALTVIKSVEAIMDQVDSVDPVAVIPPSLVYVGSFYITMYAATMDQCGSTAGITASGKKVTEDPECHTVAVDPKIIPLGTKLMIDLPGYEGVVFEAADTGGDIKNYWIDVYTDDIPLSYQFNPTYADVWIVEEN